MLAFADLAPYPAIQNWQNPQRIGPPIQSVNPADIPNWDAFNMQQAVSSIFQDNAFGQGTHANNIIVDMFNCFIQNMPHIALMRVVVVRGTDRYAYSIPYVFVSGITGAAATLRWSNYLNAHPHHGYDSLEAALAVQPGNDGMRPIDRIVKGIGDYGFAVTILGLAQDLAHSERAAALCLLYDAQHSIQDVIAALPQQHNAPPIGGIIIQIKVAHGDGSCHDCIRLFNEGALVANPPYQEPAIQPRINRIVGGQAPVIFFDNGLHAMCTNFVLRQHLAAKSGIPINNIHIRVSHKTHAGGQAATKGF
ncbi:MAG: hypothetical protein LBB25_02065 [Holosporaceae bacterium]|jgi:hypothetical protein|nr:hypothetical protein [Holosporaceae bacterium]